MEAFTRIASAIDWLNERIGRAAAYLAVALVLVQFAAVVLRYIYGVSLVWMQESVVYLHAVLFMGAAGYALLHNAHVRVDIFYREARPKTQAWVDILGTLFLLWPVCWVIWDIALPYVEMAWAVREGSREASGIPAIYLLKSMILVFAFLMALQGLSLLIHSIRVLRGEELPAPEERGLI